jgi:hypothetical protein
MITFVRIFCLKFFLNPLKIIYKHNKNRQNVNVGYIANIIDDHNILVSKIVQFMFQQTHQKEVIFILY